MFLLHLQDGNARISDNQYQIQNHDRIDGKISSHSCIHDQIIEQRTRPGRKVYSVTPQVYLDPSFSKPLYRRGRALLGLSVLPNQPKDVKRPIRINLNYDAVGHSPDRDCRNIGDIVKVGIRVQVIY